MKWYAKQLRKFCNVRLLTPQRQLKLSPAEEALRCKLTWQQFDWKMHQMCFGDEETMQKLVLSVPKLQAHIHDCVLGFSDQVPWWGMVQQRKQLYMKTELGRNAGQMKQLRGHDDEVASKYRVTLEMRQLVMHWFSADKDPVDALGKSLLIVAGVRCRLSNIDDDGKWVEGEKFTVGGEETNRVKGK